MRPAPEDGLILVTGGAGYIGSALVARLLEEGRHVRVLDPLLYGNSAFDGMADSKSFELETGEPTDRAAIDRALEGVTTVVHLGALVGDPVCARHPDLAKTLNLDSTALLVEAAAARGAQRFVFASSCSVYGASGEELDENAPLDPKSLYAETKVEGERIVLDARELSPVVLRFGTIFGDSPRPRFDLVVNLLTAKAACGEPISIHGGNQWRPFVHIQDVISSLMATSNADAALVSGEVFNVGSIGGNLRLADLGERLAECVPGAEVELSAGIVDARDYRVNFDKISRCLDFTAEWPLRAGIEAMLVRLRSGVYGDYRQPRYHNDRALAALDMITPD